MKAKTLLPVPYYQNLFTRVRVDAPTFPGVPLEQIGRAHV